MENKKDRLKQILFEYYDIVKKDSNLKFNESDLTHEVLVKKVREIKKASLLQKSKEDLFELHKAILKSTNFKLKQPPEIMFNSTSTVYAKNTFGNHRVVVYKHESKESIIEKILSLSNY